MLATLVGLAVLGGVAAPGDCRMSGVQQRWIEAAMDSWERVRVHALKLPDAPLPRLILFDRECRYTLGGGVATPARAPLLRVGRSRHAILAEPHQGTILLPDGRAIPAQPETFASIMPGDTGTFVVIALEDIWRNHPGAPQLPEDWDGYLRRVLVHEMTHARHFVSWIPSARIAGGRVGLVDVDDDIIQKRFASVPEFRELVQREIALLYEGAYAGGERRKTLVRRALETMRKRHARHFTGARAPWIEIEQVWLDAEGAAQWAAMNSVLFSSRRMGTRQAAEAVREGRTFWSQEEGLALFLALDALVPNWQQQVFAAEPKSAVVLLSQALGIE